MGFGETFKALADPARRKILELLKSGKLSAGEIAGHFKKGGSDTGREGKEFHIL